VEITLPIKFYCGRWLFCAILRFTLSLAWEAFGTKNGAPTMQAFFEAITHYSRASDPDPLIGCIALTAPFFLPRDQWVPVPDSWASNIVQGRGYDSDEPEGADLWAHIQSVLSAPAASPDTLISTVAAEAARFGQPRMITPRLGQGSFKVAVTESYQRRCAMSGEKTLPVLEAAHIRPYANDGPHLPSNGLLLRADLHTLFDRGLMTVTVDHHIEVSKSIKEDYGNGRDYYALHGQSMSVMPDAHTDRPASEFLDWHNNHVFRR
jgi:putative restriction endonuclease